jgi:hypothetical protein
MMTDIDETTQKNGGANPLREPVIRSIIHALHLPEGSLGLDVGFGTLLPRL